MPARVQIKGPCSLFTIKWRNNTYDVTHFTFVNNLLFDFSSGVQGRSPGRGSGRRSPPVNSSYKQILRIFCSNSHTIYEIETIETLIIENENYKAQLQSANSVPIRTTFIQHIKNE